MANSYTQIHIHAVFAVQNRHSLITANWQKELYKYIAAIIHNNNHRMLAINGMPDHLHVLFGMRPSQSLSDLLKDIKGSSSRWINEQGFVKGKFSWQEGYGAFSYGKSQLPQIIRYIERQQEHHQRKTFIQEYKEILNAFGIEYNEPYIFKSVE